jgi:very-short-patch-repair endonuclease
VPSSASRGRWRARHRSRMLKPSPRAVLALEDALSALPADEAREPHRRFTAADLRGLGLTKRQIYAAAAAGGLVSVRKGVYLVAGAPAAVVSAAKAGGRVACVSVLAALGVVVLDAKQTHFHFERGVSKHTPSTREQTWHWLPLARTPHPRGTSVHVIDALVQSTACQPPRAALATLDSALHLGLIEADDLDEIFQRVPARRRVLQRLVDGRAESGPETLLRLIALSLGFSVDVQVSFVDVGRVDLVLDGWLVVECDSEQFHTGWDSQARDRRRDLALAALGMTSLRPIAADIMFEPDRVRAALRGLREARRALLASA